MHVEEPDGRQNPGPQVVGLVVPVPVTHFVLSSDGTIPASHGMHDVTSFKPSLYVFWGHDRHMPSTPSVSLTEPYVPPGHLAQVVGSTPSVAVTRVSPATQGSLLETVRLAYNLVVLGCVTLKTMVAPVVVLVLMPLKAA